MKEIGWINEWGTGKSMEELIAERKEAIKKYEEAKKRINGKMILDPFVGWIPKKEK